MKLLFTALILFFSAPLLASVFYLHPIQNDDVSLASSINDLIKTTINEQGHEMTSEMDKADYTLRPHLIRLGQSYILTLSKEKNGKIIHSTKEKAANVEELDNIVNRVVRAVISEVPSKKDARVGEISDSEKRVLDKRRESRRYGYFAFGPAKTVNMDADKIGYHVSLGTLWEVSTTSAVRLAFDGTLTSDSPTALVFAGALGFNYYLSDQDTSPFIGADLGYGVASRQSLKSIAAFSGSVRAGILFFRTSTTQMEIQGKYSQIFDKNEIGYPGFAAISLGVLY